MCDLVYGRTGFLLSPWWIWFALFVILDDGYLARYTCRIDYSFNSHIVHTVLFVYFVFSAHFAFDCRATEIKRETRRAFVIIQHPYIVIVMYHLHTHKYNCVLWFIHFPLNCPEKISQTIISIASFSSVA